MNIEFCFCSQVSIVWWNTTSGSRKLTFERIVTHEIFWKLRIYLRSLLFLAFLYRQFEWLTQAFHNHWILCDVMSSCHYIQFNTPNLLVSKSLCWAFWHYCAVRCVCVKTKNYHNLFYEFDISFCFCKVYK